jgi:MFS family permease
MTAPSPVEPPVAGAEATAVAGAEPPVAGAEPPVAGAEAAVAPETSRPPLTRPLRRLLLSLFPANLSVFLLWGAVPSILLPLQVEHVNPHDKAANLAIVTTIGAFAAMLAQPLAGTLSDRTRSRFGSRAPYLAGGAVCGALALLALSAGTTLAQIVLGWALVQITYNFAQGPLSAIMPDRVPALLRGTFSAVTGFAVLLGAVGGQVIGAAFAHHIAAGYLTFAALIIVALCVFVARNPDADNRDQPRRPLSAAVVARSYWFNPRRHPDLGWAFLGRLLLYLGYLVVINYQLYILQDYIGLGSRAVKLIPVLGGATLVPLVAATLIGGTLSDRLGRRKIFVYLASGLCAVGLIAPWVSPTLAGLVVFALISGLGFGLFQSVDTALITQVLPARQDFAKDLGVVNIAATLPQVLSPGIAGVVVVLAGYRELFPLGIVFTVLGGVAVAFVRGVR